MQIKFVFGKNVEHAISLASYIGEPYDRTRTVSVGCRLILDLILVLV